MLRKTFLLASLGLVASVAEAQNVGQPPQQQCTTPDTIVVRGIRRLDDATVRADAGLIAGTELNYKSLGRAVRALYATGQFDEIKVSCETPPTDSGRVILVVEVRERPVLESWDVAGVDRLGVSGVRDRVDLTFGRPLDPSAVAKVIHRIDSLYEKNGYYLARIRAETTFVRDDAVNVTFRIDEGRRLAISGIRVSGNREVSDGEIVKSMKTRPEGFFWWRRGEFNDETFAADLSERLPALYAKRGLIDFRVARDSLIIDRERGKAFVDLQVEEGPRYRVGDFEVTGNRHFASEDIRRFYPFDDVARPFTSRVTGFLLRREAQPADVFDKARWDESQTRVSSAYYNEGYIYARVNPVMERRVTDDSQHVVDLRWEIEEQSPAIVNRIEIIGNDYTTETCIRDQLFILPGDVFNQDRLIRSWQNIGNLGFFETPMTPPDTRPANEQGDVDIVFTVKERRTGNVNFGASMGQGTGVGGFIGLDQPNLFGKCKRGSLQWQFGRYINDFSLTYSDPTIRDSRVSGTLTAYRSVARYYLADLGRSIRTGAQLQLGLPVPRDRASRLFVSYGGEAVEFGSGGLLGETQDEFGTSFRSTLGLSLTRDNRSILPFATQGSMYSLSAQFNGGPLGGTSAFQRYNAEARAYAPLGQIGGGSQPGQQPMQFTVGLTTRAGAVFGNTGPFFFSQEFALGGVQYGEQLRGYDEFSITPFGFVDTDGSSGATRNSFGKAFFTATAEAGLRVNQSLYLSLFYDAGNVWRNAKEVDPTRLFRGAGISASVVSPLGPLGLDYAYGFDRVDASGRRSPKWQLHFRLGQLF